MSVWSTDFWQPGFWAVGFWEEAQVVIDRVSGGRTGLTGVSVESGITSATIGKEGGLAAITLKGQLLAEARFKSGMTYARVCKKSGAAAITLGGPAVAGLTKVRVGPRLTCATVSKKRGISAIVGKTGLTRIRLESGITHTTVRKKGGT